ncbi:MAG: glycosyltransferase [Hyphomicrobiales bacterium]
MESNLTDICHQIRMNIKDKVFDNTFSKHDKPKASCILPTTNRPDFLLQSLYYFERQDYTNKELIIVYDFDDDLPSGLHQSDNIILIKAGKDKSIGAKRNLACKVATGDIIVQWDDDDWYAADRINKQLEPIIKGECDITAFYNTLFYDLNKHEFWECTPKLFEKICAKGVLGGTLAFRRKILSTGLSYPNSSLREDADLLIAMINKSFRLQKIDGRSSFVYMRHDMNSWKFQLGQFFSENQWNKTKAPFEFYTDAIFYNYLSKNKTLQSNTDTPKVSCIMPTANRKEFVKRSICFFENQSYLNKELIIIDDGKDSTKDIIPCQNKSIRYINLHKRRNVGEKRNFACQKATGDIIIHWDDDDYYSNNWIDLQVRHLLKSNADITGLCSLYFFDEKNKTAWFYDYEDHKKPWVHGATFCYTKSFWERNPFPNIDIGEDVFFLWNSCPKKISPHNCLNDYLGIIHRNNTSPKKTNDIRWTSIDPSQLINETKVQIEI